LAKKHFRSEKDWIHRRRQKVTDAEKASSVARANTVKEIIARSEALANDDNGVACDNFEKSAQA
jgi:hypothetical protein